MSDMHMMLGPDGKVVQVDLEPMLRRHRVSCVKTRADAIGEVADLAAGPAFDLAKCAPAARRASVSLRWTRRWAWCGN